MQRLLFFILPFIISTSLSAQKQNKEILFVGKVISNNTDFEPLYLHIINLTTSRGIISDSSGVFQIKMQKTDTLRLSCMGFKTKLITIPDSIKTSTYFSIITLETTSYIIKDVKAMALGTKSQFIYDFTHVPVDLKALEPEIIIDGVTNPNYRKIRSAKRPIYPTYIGGATGFIAKMQKKHKNLAKLSKTIKQDELIKKNNYKYNLELLSAISGYKNDTLASFFSFLNLSPEYIDNADIYQICDTIKRQKQAFERNLKKYGMPEFLQEN